MKINILYIVHDSGLYGSSRSLLDIIKYMDRKRYELYVIVPREGELLRKLRKLRAHYKVINMYQTVHYDGISSTVKQSFNKIKTNWAALKQILRYMAEWHIDIVHTNTSVVNLGAIAAYMRHVPHVWHIRELPIQFRYQSDSWFLDKVLMRKSARVICISKYIMHEVERRDRSLTPILCYDPIDTKQYLLDRERYFDEDKIHILVCGAISENKGQFDVVKAVKILHDQGYSGTCLTIVGNGNERYLNKMKNYIKKNEMQTYVFIQPFTDEIQQYRQNADIAVMSSVYEALGRVTIESMLGELAVVGADSGATSELIQNGYNGLKYKPHEPAELAKQIMYLLDHPDDAVKLIRNAKKYALETFDAEKQVKQIEALYDELIN